jgi:aerobic carbon-monoxide dehydrogenase small subunit
MTSFPDTGPPPTYDDSPVEVRCRVNGAECTLRVPAHRTLLEGLRDELGLTGSKTCCAEGECGACTVVLDGRPVTSCLVLAVEVEGHEVTTIEGLSAGGPTDLQQEFLAAGAVQCGFCIPGQVVAAECLLRANPRPTTEEVREGMAGNLCRCASYERIVAAVHATAERRAEA